MEYPIIYCFLPDDGVFAALLWRLAIEFRRDSAI